MFDGGRAVAEVVISHSCVVVVVAVVIVASFASRSSWIVVLVVASCLPCCCKCQRCSCSSFCVWLLLVAVLSDQKEHKTKPGKQAGRRDL